MIDPYVEGLSFKPAKDYISRFPRCLSMHIASLRSRMERLIQTHSSAFIPAILGSGFSCARCGWCCRENFNIRITEEISRPSNAISIFPDDIRRIIKSTGKQWDEVAQPDTYSCLSDGEGIWAIGWILRRNNGNCVFYRDGECSIYEWRPAICRCYPFFMGEPCVDIMRCEGLGNRMTRESAGEMAMILKRYELKKLRSYVHIIEQLGDRLSLASLVPLPRGYEGELVVCDGEGVTRWHLQIK